VVIVEIRFSIFKPGLEADPSATGSSEGGRRWRRSESDGGRGVLSPQYFDSLRSLSINHEEDG